MFGFCIRIRVVLWSTGRGADCPCRKSLVVTDGSTISRDATD